MKQKFCGELCKSGYKSDREHNVLDSHYSENKCAYCGSNLKTSALKVIVRVANVLDGLGFPKLADKLDYIVKHAGDIHCRVCREPWDAAGVREHMDMDKDEAKKFMQGKGCPHCDFGRSCPSCKKHPGKEECEKCWGKGSIGGKSPYYGDTPIQDCYMCDGKGHRKTACPSCEGTGKPKKGDVVDFARNLTDESDEEPMELIHNIKGFPKV